MLVGALHELPSKVKAFPMTSTAAQNDADRQETATRSFVPSMPTGALHELPLNVSALPRVSTVTQNDADGQETDSSPAEGRVSMLVGALHEEPLKITALPL